MEDDIEFEERNDLQRIGGRKNLTPEQALAELERLKAGGKGATYWNSLQPVLVDDPTKLPTKKRAAVQCTGCSKRFAVCNLSNLSSTHFTRDGHCKRPQAAAATASEPSAGALMAMASSSGSSCSNNPKCHPGQRSDPAFCGMQFDQQSKRRQNSTSSDSSYAEATSSW